MLTSSSVVSYFIAFLMMPIISRIYSQEDLGVYYSLVAIVAIVSSFINMRLDIAIPLVKNRMHAMRLLQVSVVLTGLMTVPFTGLFYWASQTGYFGFEHYPLWATGAFAGLIILNVVYISIYAVLHYEQDYVQASKVAVLNMASRNSAQIGFKFLFDGPLGMAVGEVLARCVSIFYMIKTSRLLRSRASYLFHWHGLLNVLRENKAYPVYVAPSSLMLAISTSLTTPVILSLYGSAMAGQYALAATVAIIPITILGKSVNNVYSRSFSIAFHGKKYDELLGLMKRTLISTAALSLIMYLTLAMVSAPAFPIVFGSGWEQAGEICIFLALSFIMYLPVMVLEKSMFLFGREKVKLFYDGVNVAILVVIFYSAQANHWNIIAVVKLIAISKNALAFIQLAHVYLIVKRGVVDRLAFKA